MATRLRIDTAFAEEAQRRDPIEVEIPGLGVFTLPGVMNAMASVRVARWSAQGKTEIEPMDAVLLLGDLVPDDVLTEWHRLGFDVFSQANGPMVEQMVTQLMGEYQRRAEEVSAVDPPDRSATAPTPLPSSVNGPSWQPTSPPSTASPFPVT